MPFPLHIILLTCCCFAWASPPQDRGPLRFSHLKVYQSRHLAIYYTVQFRDEVRPLAREAEGFLEKLEKEWSVTLPRRRIRISLSKNEREVGIPNHFEGPPWLKSRYFSGHNRIDLFVSDPARFQREPVVHALEHYLVHYLLNMKSKKKLAPFLEEGLAQHYAGHQKSRERFLAIWAFYRHEDVQACLEDETTFEKKSEFFQGAALARSFVAWLFSENPRAEVPFLQSLLKGNSFERALVEAGMVVVRPEDTDEDEDAEKLALSAAPPEAVRALFQRFDWQVRPTHKLHTILFTFDFWLILLGMIALLGMVFRIVTAIRMALTRFHPIEEGTESPVNVLFEGPAFGGVPPEWREPEANPLGLNRSTIEEAEIGGLDTALDALEEDLNQAFAHMLEDRKEMSRKYRKGVDEDVDKVFGDWQQK